jgi:RNA polymerase sigma-70 factor, ECF subfamily
MASREEIDEHETRLVQWVAEHATAVRGFARGVLRSDELADDIVQEVFHRAWQARARYAERGTSRAYLLRIADRLIGDHYRRAHREVTLDDSSWEELEPEDRSGTPEAIRFGEEQAALERALRTLSPLQRRVLLLRFYGDLPFDEIAATIGIPLNTTLSHCRRGLLSLRKILTESSP